MSTKFPEPKSDKYQSIDGWITPDYSDDKRFYQDPYDAIRANKETLAPINSFEFQQGIFGQYRHFYGIKSRNNFTKACFGNCITAKSLKTSNLSQEDKLCARECLLSSEQFQNATNIFLEKSQNDLTENREFVLLDNQKYFS